MADKAASGADAQLIDGEFFTDGKTFVFRMSGTPYTGTGSDPAAAFQDLMRINAATGDFGQRFRELARDQQGEAVRATIVRYVMIALIAFSLVGGSLAAAAVMLPKVAADLSSAVYVKLAAEISDMKPEKEDKIIRFLQRIQSSLHEGDNCRAPANPPTPGSQ